LCVNPTPLILIFHVKVSLIGASSVVLPTTLPSLEPCQLLGFIDREGLGDGILLSPESASQVVPMDNEVVPPVLLPPVVGGSLH
jgi:hypothetical protein